MQKQAEFVRFVIPEGRNWLRQWLISHSLSIAAGFFFPRWISSHMNEGNAGATGDYRSLGRWCFQCCATKMDDVVQQHTRRDNIAAMPQPGASTMMAPWRRWVTLRTTAHLKKKPMWGPWDCAAPAAAVSSPHRGFTLIKWHQALLPFFILKWPPHPPRNH